MRRARVLFFFNDTAATEIYTRSLHDALPISRKIPQAPTTTSTCPRAFGPNIDRKSTRLNSSHANTSYAVFCLKKTIQQPVPPPLPPPASLPASAGQPPLASPSRQSTPGRVQH